MNDLPDKVVHMDQVRINRGITKACRCQKKKYVLDTTNRRVHCSSCGAIIDPFEAMREMALHWERVNEQIDLLLKQRKQIQNYKPWLITIRNLEKQYRGKKMLPNCPRCSEPFFLEELNHWSGRSFAEARIKKWRQEHGKDS
ncbi:hypothetical protein CAI16_19540 [Virgibacillus dokdonensis]|uniref:Uncharacterized protein n=1 Tax=Virgibacillus dokdonensis TaxID=302167 RepID=A0A3E0WGM4_9BACI|nr:hypothetical protein [Virgibacillus dokdonensis]RFA31908.1 hypothetical protein CAI16_19540 [Virgibacillus dokdonensis]